MDLGIPGLTDATEVGRGGFSIVYAATDVAVGRTVAVKVLSSSLNDGNRRQFDREVKALGRLGEHPNIVTLLQTGTTAGGLPYIVMPYLEQGTVARRMRPDGLSEAEVVKLGRAMCEGLEAAHAEGIVHCDLKPANVLITDFDEYQLADFGITRFVDVTATTTSMAATPAYGAPELLDGQRPTPASDVYGIGATMHAAARGAPPFSSRDGEGVFAVIRRVMSDPPPDLRESGLSGALADLVAATMAKEPGRRPDLPSVRAALDSIAIGDATTPVVSSIERAAAAETEPNLTQPMADSEATSTKRSSVLRVAVTIIAAVAVGLAAYLVTSNLGSDPSPEVDDGVTTSAVRTLDLDHDPTSIATVGDAAWISSAEFASVFVVDPSTDDIGRFDVGEQPGTPTPVGDEIWVPNRASGTVSVIDSGVVTDTIAVGGGPWPGLEAGGLVWFPLFEDNSVVAIDPENRSIVERVPVGQAPWALMENRGQLWVSNWGDGSVSVLDTLSRDEIVRVDVGGPPFVAERIGGRAWIPTLGTALVSVDLDSFEIVHEVDLGGPQGALTVTGTELWVPLVEQNRIAIVNATTGTVAAELDVGGVPERPAVSTGVVVVPVWDQGQAVRIDARTYEIIDRLDVGARPGPALTLAGEVWIPNTGSSSIAVVSVDQPDT
ncbi:MAG: protein kinase [Actinomycetota bacterium]